MPPSDPISAEAPSVARLPTATAIRIEPPPGWGTDPLSAFIDQARHNQFATFARHQKWFKRFVELDGCFLTIGKDWINPPNIVTPLLFFRAHAAYRAVSGLTVGGQIAETFPTLRSCLEYSCYALHISRNPELGEVWLHRHKDAATLKRVKNKFTVKNVRDTLRACNRHAADRFDLLYDRTIDFGGHPNERAVTGSMAITERDGKHYVVQKYLHGDGVELLHGLKTTTQVGLVSLEIFNEVFGPRFELLGVKDRLLKARRTFEKVGGPESADRQ